MNCLLRLFKTLSTKKQQLNYDKARVTRQLYQEYKGRKSIEEIKEYVDRLTLEEIEQLTKKRKLS